MIPDLLRRAVWEQPGYTVAQHTDAGPQPFDRAQYVVIHYTAAGRTPEDSAGVRNYIASIQRDYADNRGYSIGYNWVVDRAGRIWEARGDDHRCAANGGSESNTKGPAVLCLVNGDDLANQAMIAAVRTVVAHCEAKAGRLLTVVGHRDVRSTSCPGAGLYGQVKAGTFRPVPELPQEDEMQPLTVPRRVYDSRNVGAKLAAGETRVVDVGRRAAFLHLTVVDADGRGYLTMTGATSTSSASIVNYDKNQPPNSDGAPIGLPDGRVRVTAVGAATHVIIDVFAETPS